jgi:hypothetical protein
MPFRFDRNLTPAQNVNAFYDYMTFIDKRFALLLKEELQKLTPVPEGQAARQAARAAFNSTVTVHLDASAKSKPK